MHKKNQDEQGSRGTYIILEITHKYEFIHKQKNIIGIPTKKVAQLGNPNERIPLAMPLLKWKCMGRKQHS